MGENKFALFYISHTHKSSSKALLKCSLAFWIVAASVGSRKWRRWTEHTRLAPDTTECVSFQIGQDKVGRKTPSSSSNRPFPLLPERANQLTKSLAPLRRADELRAKQTLSLKETEPLGCPDQQT